MTNQLLGNDEQQAFGGETAGSEVRQRSTIRFPYSDLGDVEDLAAVMHRERGREAEVATLAADMGASVKSGTFRNKLAAGVVFGVFETLRGEGRIRLTALGERLVDTRNQRAARVEAFLAVPLYRAIYSEFKGARLPGDPGIEAEMVGLGVSAKQASKARQTMVRSADVAGFYGAGRDRLVEPSLRPAGDGVVEEKNLPEGEGQSGDAQRKLLVMDHPLIQGLLQVLPEPGQPLSADRRKQWLSTFEMNLQFIFPEPPATEQRQPSEQSQNAGQG